MGSWRARRMPAGEFLHNGGTTQKCKTKHTRKHCLISSGSHKVFRCPRIICLHNCKVRTFKTDLRSMLWAPLSCDRWAEMRFQDSHDGGVRLVKVTRLMAVACRQQQQCPTTNANGQAHLDIIASGHSTSTRYV